MVSNDVALVNRMPPELLLRSLTYVAETDRKHHLAVHDRQHPIVTCMKVCRLWFHVSSASILWTRICLNDPRKVILVYLERSNSRLLDVSGCSLDRGPIPGVPNIYGKAVLQPDIRILEPHIGRIGILHFSGDVYVVGQLLLMLDRQPGALRDLELVCESHPLVIPESILQRTPLLTKLALFNVGLPGDAIFQALNSLSELTIRFDTSFADMQALLANCTDLLKLDIEPICGPSTRHHPTTVYHLARLENLRAVCEEPRHAFELMACLIAPSSARYDVAIGSEFKDSDFVVDLTQIVLHSSSLSKQMSEATCLESTLQAQPTTWKLVSPGQSQTGHRSTSTPKSLV